ncbi:MAG: choice-of-anchor D domain-containing protein [Candidatus Acidiferrales bacterium]
MRKILIAVLLMLGAPVLARAQNYYYAQTAQGANNGTSCANAYAYNDISNGMTLKAAAGVTLHICGTWNGAANQQWATFTTSGTGPSGTGPTCTNPISLIWEAGAVIQAPYHNTSTAGFVFDNQSCWVLNGQISAGVYSSCNIATYNSGACPSQLQNTLNGGISEPLSGVSVSGGTATATCTTACKPYINPANSNDIAAVIISGTSVAACNVKVQPLTNVSTTVFTYATPAGCTTATGGTVSNVCPAGACTYQQGNAKLIQANNVSHFIVENGHWGPSSVDMMSDTNNGSELVQINGSFTSVHDMTAHDGGSIWDETTYTNGQSAQFYNNDLWHACWLMGFAGAGTVFQDLEWFNNHEHDIGNFSNGSVGTCHGNGIHFYNQGNGSGGNAGGVQAIYHHDNLADGDWGVATSGVDMFIEGRSPCGGLPASGPSDSFANGSGSSTGTLYEWNDVIAGYTTPGNPPNGVPAISCGNKHFIVNNYFLGNGTTGNGTIWDNNPSIDSTQTGTTQVNNIRQSTDVLYQQIGSSQAAPVQIDYNIYGNNAGGNNAWQTAAVNTSSFTTWQAGGFDTHGFHYSGLVPNLNSCATYECGAAQPTGSFVGLSAGTNLTSTCTANANLAGLCMTSTAGGTATAVARPTTGSWNIGPFGLGVGVTLTPTPYAFAATALGSNSSDSPVTFTLTNNTGVTITGVTISFTGSNPGDFSKTTSCVTTLASGASCQIFVTFTPTAIGSRTATLNVSDSDASSPQTSSLSGTAIPSVINPSPANPVTFGVVVTDPSIPSTVKNEKHSANLSAYNF